MLVAWSQERVRTGRTYKADKDLIAGLDRDLAAVFVEDHAGLGLAVGAEDSIDTDGFHAVAEELLVRFFRVVLGQAVDFREVFLALF